MGYFSRYFIKRKGFSYKSQNPCFTRILNGVSSGVLTGVLAVRFADGFIGVFKGVL